MSRGIEVYEHATVRSTMPGEPHPVTVEIAYAQGGRHFRRCAACDGFHYAGSFPGERLESHSLAVVPAGTDPRTRKGRIPPHLCEYRDRRGTALPAWLRRVASGEEPRSAGFPPDPHDPTRQGC